MADQNPSGLTAILASAIDAAADLDLVWDNSATALKSMTPAEKAKLIAAQLAAGSVALSALASDPLARANHTGTQTASTISDFTEAAQDAVGGAMTDGTTIDFTYSDVGNTITAEVIDATITNAKLATEAQSTIKGRAAAAGTGAVTDLTATQVRTIIDSNTTPSTQAFGDSAAVGTADTLARGDHKHAWPSFASPTVALGSSASAGSATTPIRSDATIAAFDATSPTTQAIGDSAVVGTAAFAARRDHKHAMPAFATNAVVLGSSAAAGSAATLIRSDATIAAFDATSPTTQALGDSAVVGTAAFAARRDHKHAFPSATTILGAVSGVTSPTAGNFSSNVNTVATTGSTETLDTTLYAVHDCTMDQNCTFTFSNPAASGKNTTFVLILRGAFTPTFPAAVKWGDGAAPTYSTPTIYTFTTVDAGTTYYGQSVAKAFS